mmetsp:Transcript_26959/g.67770  ORF Transcript_26959/g.67770 Transcript_26959/m.67770 type:complete len:126 (+) Transcript_26959:295-672(+)
MFRSKMCFVIVFSLTSRSTFESALQHLESMDLTFDGAPVGRLLVGTKLDAEEQREVTNSEAQLFATQHGLEYVEVSAKEQLNLDKLKQKLLYAGAGASQLRREQFEEFQARHRRRQQRRNICMIQ